jgi:hypothetical protein
LQRYGENDQDGVSVEFMICVVEEQSWADEEERRLTGPFQPKNGTRGLQLQCQGPFEKTLRLSFHNLWKT